MRPKDLSTAIEVRRGEIERVRSAGAQDVKVTGTIQVTEPGEAVISVTFPTLYVNKPDFTFGPELGPGQALVIQSLPSACLTVVQWGEAIRDDGTVLYAGATFAVVTEGPIGQVMLIQWHMDGLALRGPSPIG